MNLEEIQLEAKFFKGFSDQSRLLILSLILDGPKTVSKIVEESNLSQPNTSAHLSCLLECGLIKKEKIGREVFYEVSSSDVSNIIKYTKKILQKNSKTIYSCVHYSN